MNEENGMTVGATEAYEAAHREPYSEDVLDEAVERLMDAIATVRGEVHPVLLHAREHIEDCLLDDTDALMFAVWRAVDQSDYLLCKLMRIHTEIYAKGHLSTLVEHFKIETGEKK